MLIFADNYKFEAKMNWLETRLKEKSTYAGIATLGLGLLQSAIPIPFAGEIIHLVAGAILVAVKEHKA